MKKGVKIIVLIIVAVVLAAAGTALVKLRQKEDAKTAKPVVYPLKVAAITPKKGHIITTVPYLALVKNDKNVQISSKFPGRILYIKSLGSSVKKGETVLKVDSTDLRVKLNGINANISTIKNALLAQQLTLDNTKKTYERTKKLYKVNMASLQDVENLQNKIALLNSQIVANREKLNTLYADRKNILNQLSYADVKSPINGTVSLKNANAGDIAAPMKPLLGIASNSGYYLFLALNRADEIRYKGKIYKAVPLHETFNSLNTYKVKVNDGNLTAGEKVGVDVVTYDGNATLVPFDALLSINGENYVFDTEGKAEKIKVIAKGIEGVVTDTHIPGQIIKANPDILLRIKAGYPVKVEQ